MLSKKHPVVKVVGYVIDDINNPLTSPFGFTKKDDAIAFATQEGLQRDKIIPVHESNIPEDMVFGKLADARELLKNVETVDTVFSPR